MQETVQQADLARQSLRASRLSRYLDSPGQCPAELPNRPLLVSDILEHALCSSPQERRARASYLSQVAQMKMREDAYWPSVWARGTFGLNENTRTVKDAPLFDSSLLARDRSSAIDLQWTLIDFGRRNASLEAAKKQVAGAGADYDGALQQIVLGAVDSYYQAVDAVALLAAARRSEESARLILEIAEGRLAGGVGVVTDKLMAQTTLLQTSASRSFAEGRSKSTQGLLALTMGLDASTRLELATPPEDLPAAASLDSVGEVLRVALENSPQVQAAQARLAAAESSLRTAQLVSAPSIDLVAGVGKSKRAYSSGEQDFGLYDSPGDSMDRSWNVQLRLSVPIISGFARSNAVTEAIAQINIRRAELAAAERMTSQEIWQSYQLATTQMENLRITAELLAVARESLEAATFRYESGSGTMVEVLNAQTALTNVEQRRVEAFSSWREARVRLALRMGMEIRNALSY